MPDPTEDAFDKAVAILSEHFQHYAVVVQYDDGSIYHQGDNHLVEKALYQEALQLIKESKMWDDDIDIEWDDEDEDDDESWLEEDDD